MLAQEWIDDYIQQTGSAQPRSAILKILNKRQNKLLGMDTEMLRVLPDPYFHTTDQVYSYVANSVTRDSSSIVPGALVGDIRVIREVYNSRCDWDGYAYGGIPAWGGWNGGRYVVDPFGGDRYIAPVTCIEARNPDNNTCLMKWDLRFNPGEHETLWRCRAYLWPKQILTEQDEITMPDDFIDDLLVWEVQASIDRASYGRNDYAQAAAEETLKRFKTKYATPPIYTRPLQSPALNA